MRYSQLQQEIAQAQQQVLRAQRDANAAEQQYNDALRNQQNNAGRTSSTIGALAGLSTVFSTAAVGDAKRNLDNLQREFAREPQQIEEPVMDNWRYEIYDLSLQGEAVLSFKTVNFTTSEIGESSTVRAADSVSDTWVQGDPSKGVYDDPNTLPDVDVFQSQLLDQATVKLVAALEKQLGSGAIRHFETAQEAAERGETQRAIEHYMRYLYSAPSLSDPNALAADSYIYDNLGLRMIRGRRD